MSWRQPSTACRPRAGRPKFVYTIPNFQNPGGVTMSLERRRRLVQVARERELLVLEDNPYGLLRYEGEPLPTLYSLDAASFGRSGKSDFVIYLGTFSKILSPGIRLGWAVAPRPVLEKLNLGKQGADLCSSSMTQLFVARYFDEHDWRGYLQGGCGELYSAQARRDAGAPCEEHFGEEAHWTTPQGGLFIWATLPRVHRHHQSAGGAMQSEGVAFVPGRAAYVDGRPRRLLDAAELRRSAGSRRFARAIRRIGKVVERQIGIFGALTGSPRTIAARTDPPGAPQRAASGPRGGPDDKRRRRPKRGALPPRRHGWMARRPPAARLKVAVLRGWTFAGAWRVAALGGAGGGGAERRATRRRDRRRAGAGRALRAEAVDGGVRGAARRRRRERYRAGAAGGSASPTRGRGRAACMRTADKGLAKHLMGDGGYPHARVPLVHRGSRFRELGLAAGAGSEMERSLGYPLVVKPAGRAPRWA